MRKPRCVVLAGPNGAGKSTFHNALDMPETFVNADLVAARLNPVNPEKSAIAAGRIVIAELNQIISEKRDFIYETTLSSRHSLKMIEAARAAGFDIGLVFIVLDSVELHIMRVRQRVSQGGHHIDEPTIRRRYEACFQNLTLALPHTDALAVFDNSRTSGAERKVEIQAGSIVFNSLKSTSTLDRRIATALGISLA